MRLSLRAEGRLEESSPKSGGDRYGWGVEDSSRTSDMVESLVYKSDANTVLASTTRIVLQFTEAVTMSNFRCDVNADSAQSRDRKEAETSQSRDREEAETSQSRDREEAETSQSRDREEAETSQSRDREGAVPGMGVAPGVSPVSGLAAQGAADFSPRGSSDGATAAIHSACGTLDTSLPVGTGREAPEAFGLRDESRGNGNVRQLLAYDATGPTVNATPAAKHEGQQGTSLIIWGSHDREEAK